jgi:hypothetical protein
MVLNDRRVSSREEVIQQKFLVFNRDPDWLFANANTIWPILGNCYGDSKE